MKRYIRCIADRRLTQLSLQPIYRSDANKHAAVDGPDAERHRAHQLFRELRDGILEGVDAQDDVRGRQAASLRQINHANKAVKEARISHFWHGSRMRRQATFCCQETL